MLAAHVHVHHTPPPKQPTPQPARQSQSPPISPNCCSHVSAGGGVKEAVHAYFNSTEFERWCKIYGSASEGVNRVQLDIRDGNAHTVAATLSMLRDHPHRAAGRDDLRRRVREPFAVEIKEPAGWVRP
jgi:hypothetical protein